MNCLYHTRVLWLYLLRNTSFRINIVLFDPFFIFLTYTCRNIKTHTCSFMRLPSVCKSVKASVKSLIQVFPCPSSRSHAFNVYFETNKLGSLLTDYVLMILFGHVKIRVKEVLTALSLLVPCKWTTNVSYAFFQVMDVSHLCLRREKRSALSSCWSGSQWRS